MSNQDKGSCNKKLIGGLTVKNSRLRLEERGRLVELLRADDKEFSKFGQAYITTAYPYVVKAWHYHTLQDDNMVVLKKTAKIASQLLPLTYRVTGRVSTTE